MFSTKNNAAIASGLLLAIFLWGANNAGTKYLVTIWPPLFTGGTRFLLAGLILAALLRWTKWFGDTHPLTTELRRQLWWRGGLSLAAYVLAFNWALQLTSASHVALYLAASPVWALMWEGRPAFNLKAVQRYVGALLALAGVGVLFFPAIKTMKASFLGEVMGLLVSIMWTLYGHQCRHLGQRISGVEATAQTMWRAGIYLLVLSIFELARGGFQVTTGQISIQVYCILAGAVVAFALWNNGLRHWPTSRVFLFTNLIPLSTAIWAHYLLGETITPTFWLAMVLVSGGVLLGQPNFYLGRGKAVAEAESFIEL